MAHFFRYCGQGHSITHCLHGFSFCDSCLFYFWKWNKTVWFRIHTYIFLNSITHCLHDFFLSPGWIPFLKNRIKPSYFKKQCFFVIFVLPKFIIEVQSGNEVLKRLVPCIWYMELACWVLYCHFGPLLLPYLGKKMMTKNIAS